MGKDCAINESELPGIRRVLEELPLGGEDDESHFRVAQNRDLMSLLQQTGPPLRERHLPVDLVLYPPQLHSPSPHSLLSLPSRSSRIDQAPPHQIRGRALHQMYVDRSTDHLKPPLSLSLLIPSFRFSNGLPLLLLVLYAVFGGGKKLREISERYGCFALPRLSGGWVCGTYRGYCVYILGEREWVFRCD
ncbi:unnamed protein product [Linum trigynum]|uniref:Uncharacterized protein n=1 Tax=Linum trigynum TaxID=586398 RepID=A0AAV2EV21_9ROSI